MTSPARLDHTQKQAVSYCIPLEIRDLQIEAAIKRVQKRIAPHPARPERVAVVCFGPTLADTWEQVKDFEFVITCSGSHKFLVERGIIPTYHVEVDPRPHKVALIGPPQDGTIYCIASTCHRAVFDHLEGKDVRLWHVFDAKENGERLLPPGEVALTGGCDVGSRAMTIAGFLGFRDLHVFGMDGCQKGDAKHAAAHPNEAKKYNITEYAGIEYRTTPALLEAGRQVFHELDQMPAIRATFYGDGLVQAMAKDYVQKIADPAKPFESVVGFIRPQVISPAYAALNARLHEERVEYGIGGGKHAVAVAKLCQSFHTTSVLDYGCGKSQLAKALPFPIWEYDPGVPGKAESPRPADIVVCTDVLEHIEPEYLNGVLADLQRVTRKLAYLVIHTGPSSKSLADGRNAHLIQRDAGWWKERLGKFFKLREFTTPRPLVTFVAEPRKRRVIVPSPATLPAPVALPAPAPAPVVPSLPLESSCKTPSKPKPSTSRVSRSSRTTSSTSPKKRPRKSSPASSEKSAKSKS